VANALSMFVFPFGGAKPRLVLPPHGAISPAMQA